MTGLNDLKKQFQTSLIRIRVLENQLNHCGQAEHDEIAIELKAENERLGRIKRELVEQYRDNRVKVAL